MKRKRLLGGLFCALFVLTLLPLSAGAAEVGEITVSGGTADHTAMIEAMKDGEVYTYSTVTQVGGEDSTDFDVSLSAVGQKYPATETNMRPTVTVLVLDFSNSMKESISSGENTQTTRMDALKQAASTFIDEVVPSESGGGTNYVGVVTYGTYAYKTLDFTNDSSTLSNTIDHLTYPSGDTGGTNTHGGLIAAYKMINEPTSFGLSPEQLEDAAYSVVFMSDGVPTYCYDLYNVTTINTHGMYRFLEFSGQNNRLGVPSNSYLQLYIGGPGNASNQYTIENAQAAANLLKNAVTEPSVYSVFINNPSYESARNTMEAIASSEENTYSPGDASTLASAFQEIAVQINNREVSPISERLIEGKLSPKSYVDIAYTVGSGYRVGAESLKISLSGEEYSLTPSKGSDESKTVFTSGESALAKLSVTLENGELHFRVPASLLPCNSPEPSEGEIQTFAAPIGLTFRLAFDHSGLSAGEYPTSSAAAAGFYPTEGNPHYYGEHQAEGPVELASNTTATTYYAATFPYQRYGETTWPTLNGFANGNSIDELEYIDDVNQTAVEQYSIGYHGPRSMNVSYQGKTVSFNQFNIKRAKAVFTYDDGILVENFMADNTEHKDAIVKETSNYRYLGNYHYFYDYITVGYNKGQEEETTQSITFKNVILYWDHSDNHYTSNWCVEYFYYTEASATVPGGTDGFLLDYKKDALLVKIPASGGKTDLTYCVNENNVTAIMPAVAGQSSYTVTQLSGGTYTYTTYYVEAGVLRKRVTTAEGKNGLQLDRGGRVEQTLTSGASVVLVNATPTDPDECVTNVTLTSLSGGRQTIASSRGEANLLLTLTVTGTVKSIGDIDLKLAATGTKWKDGSLPFTVSSVTTDDGGPVSEGGLPNTLSEGTYQIYLTTTTPYSEAEKKSIEAAFQSLTFTPEGAAGALTLDGNGSDNQKVNIILITAPGH